MELERTMGYTDHDRREKGKERCVCIAHWNRSNIFVPSHFRREK